MVWPYYSTCKGCRCFSESAKVMWRRRPLIGRKNIGHCPFSEASVIYTTLVGDWNKCFEVIPPLYSGDCLPLYGKISVAFCFHFCAMDTESNINRSIGSALLWHAEEHFFSCGNYGKYLFSPLSSQTWRSVRNNSVTYMFVYCEHVSEAPCNSSYTIQGFIMF
jgi:hypothetical protein